MHENHKPKQGSSELIGRRHFVQTAAALSSFGALYATELKLTPEHQAAVNRQRRIFFQYDPAADIQKKGGFGADMDAVMRYVFDFADLPGSQLDAICIDVSNEGVAHYRSKILRPIQHPGLVKWRERGLDYFDELIKQGHRRGKEVWWGLRINEVERGDLIYYEKGGAGSISDERNPVKAAHPEWLIRSWWWQGFYNYAVKEVRAYRLSIIQEVAEQYDAEQYDLTVCISTSSGTHPSCRRASNGRIASTSPTSCATCAKCCRSAPPNAVGPSYWPAGCRIRSRDVTQTGSILPSGRPRGSSTYSSSELAPSTLMWRRSAKPWPEHR